MKKMTPNQKEQIKHIIEEVINLDNSVKINNFFSLAYIKSRSSRKLNKKTKKYFFRDIQKFPQKYELINVFKEYRYADLLDNGFIKEYQYTQNSPIYVRPTFLALKLAEPELFDKFLDFLDYQFDYNIEEVLKQRDLNSIQLAILFFLILNGNFGESNTLNISSPNMEVEKFLTPWLREFADEIDKSLLQKDTSGKSRTLKAYFRTNIDLINRSIGYPIKAPGGHKYMLTIPLSDYTVNAINNQLGMVDHILLQKILYKYFKKLNEIKGKMELSGIKSYYEPLKTSEILAKFYLKITDED